MLSRIEEKVVEHFEASKESHQSLREHMDAGFSRIESKQDYTNGKVGDLVQWRERIIGMATIVTMILVPILTWALWQVVNLDDQIAKALDGLEIQIVE